MMKAHQISIVIITEKNILTKYEEISLNRALKVFSDYNKYLIISEDTDPQYFLDPNTFIVIKLPKLHFENVNTYSTLLLSDFFYNHFVTSEYILIYQLDCFVFKNNLKDFLGFDYIGAPWFNSQNHAANSIINTLIFRKPFWALKLVISWFLRTKTSGVGNGGFSLRKVDKFLEITADEKIKKIIVQWVKNKRPHEDIFYSYIIPLFAPDFKIADISTALKFSFETYPRKCFALNNQELPLGCHAWAKNDIQFWREVFDSLDYTI